MDLSAITAAAAAAWQALHFLRPAWLLALPLLWAAVVWLARRRGRAGDWSGLIDAELLAGLQLAAGPDRRAGVRAAAPWPWLALAWTLGVVALAGPSWSRDQSPAFRAGSSWVLVLDLSPSMAAGDLTPNRATRARYAIDDLLSAAHDARVALVVFGAEAYTVAPLTDDVDNVRSLLPPLAPDILPVAGDQLGPALVQAQRLLAAAASRAGHVVVLSDGFDDPAAALQAAAALRSGGATVDMVSMGTSAGAPLPAAGGGFVTDAAGQLQLMRVDSEPLQRVATAGGGRLVALDDLPSLLRSLQAAPAEAAHGEGATTVEVSHWRDAGAWLLPVLLLVVALLTRRGWL